MTDFVLPFAPDWDSPVLDNYGRACLFHRDASLADAVQHCRSRLCYLATPFPAQSDYIDGQWCAASAVESSVRAARWLRLLAVEGLTAVSPVSQAVELVQADHVDQQLDPMDDAFWTLWARPLLFACGAVIVPQVPGWRDSDAVWRDVRAALHVSRSVFLIRSGEEFGGAA